MFVTQIAHASHWHQTVSIKASCDSSGRLIKFQQLCPTNGHTYPNKYNRYFGSQWRDGIVALTNFAVMMDECTNVNGVQVSICIRFLEYLVEMLLGCWSIQSKKTDPFHRCIGNVVLVQIVCALHHSLVCQT